MIFSVAEWRNGKPQFITITILFSSTRSLDSCTISPLLSQQILLLYPIGAVLASIICIYKNEIVFRQYTELSHFLLHTEKKRFDLARRFTSLPRFREIFPYL